VHELGVTDPGGIALWSGLLAAITPATSGLMSPVVGRLADRFGRKMMLVRSLVGFSLIIGAMGLVTSVHQLLVARFVQGLFAGFSPMAIALASVSAPRDKVPLAIARVQGAQLLSVAVGPALGGFVASRFGTRTACFVTAAMCAASLVVLVILFREGRAPEGDEARPAVRATPLRVFLGTRHFVPVLALLLIAQFVDRSLGLMIPLKVAHLPGVTAGAETAGLIISVAAVGAAVSASLSARLSAVIPTGRLLLVEFLLGGVGCLAMAAAPSAVALLVLRTLTALCLGGTATLAFSLGGMIVPARARAEAFGWLAFGVQFGTAASPMVSGALAAASLGAAFVMDAALAWLAAGVLLLVARELLTRREPRGAADVT
jgi:DHA1 family multidrug resistance protein-like MFS transporter